MDEARRRILVLPFVAITILLWLDVFDLKHAFWKAKPDFAAASLSSATTTPPQSDVAPTLLASTKDKNYSVLPTTSPLHSECLHSGEIEENNLEGERQGLRRPLVGAVIAVHPPRFYYAARFLESFAACTSAQEAMKIAVVFTGKQDLALFREAQERLTPDVPSEIWAPVICDLPEQIKRSHNQYQAAWKKWFGIAYLLDQKEDAPEYGVMLDSELEFYDRDACKQGGEWTRLFHRLRRREHCRSFPAARVGKGLVTYDFRGRVLDGIDYDRRLLKENAVFMMTHVGDIFTCGMAGCDEVRRQIELCLFSWWTDLPYLNLTIARRMLQSVAGKSVKTVGSWQSLAKRIKFPRFEYIAYQQWCCIHEGFHFRDVTSITGEARWGSYLEDPQPGARIHDLEPLWIASDALVRSERGVIPKMSKTAPPLLVFHLDHEAQRFEIFPEKTTWEKTLLQILQEQGRNDWNAQTIQ